MTDFTAAILAEKRRFAALPAWRREQLQADFDAATDRARRRAAYVRPS